jgi:hypothetical protein
MYSLSSLTNRKPVFKNKRERQRRKRWMLWQALHLLLLCNKNKNYCSKITQSFPARTSGICTFLGEIEFWEFKPKTNALYNIGLQFLPHSSGACIHQKVEGKNHRHFLLTIIRNTQYTVLVECRFLIFQQVIHVVTAEVLTVKSSPETRF